MKGGPGLTGPGPYFIGAPFSRKERVYSYIRLP